MKNLQMLILSALLSTLSLNASEKPNLIVIMCDDLGYADVGFNGCKDIPTPGIDRIAAEGVKFTNAYVTYSVCGPSRAGFITGRYQQRFGFERNPQYQPNDPNMGLPQEEQTIAEALKKVGYTSGIIGKWHLGAHISNHPLNRGFDSFFGHLGGGHKYFPEDLTIRDSYSINDEWKSYQTWIMRDHEPVQIAKYLTDEFSDEAIGFVERNRDKPFFLFLSYNAPHLPLQASEEYLSRFPNIQDKGRRTYAAMVSAVDDGVVRLLEKLDDLKLSENTIVFFLSDNGGPAKNASRNSPLRGYKSDVWEGGIRVPMAVRWPARFDANKVFTHPVTSLDIFATIASESDVPADEDRPLDGVNLVPFLTGATTERPHSKIFIRKYDQKRYVLRFMDYKLVINGPGEQPMLFALPSDVGERNNLAPESADKVEILNKMLRDWESEMIDPVFLGLIHRK